MLSELRLRTKLSDDAMKEMAGKRIEPGDYDVLITGPTRVLRPDGKPLCVYRPKAIGQELRDTSWAILHGLKGSNTSNRGLAAGSERYQGPSQRSYAMLVDSATLGSFRGQGPRTYCRLTAWTGRENEQWKGLWPLFGRIAEELAEHVPSRYAAQVAEANKTASEWVVAGTPFTTITVNNCVDAATECLTKRAGWTSYEDVREDDQLLAYDPETHTTRWEKLQGKFVNADYSGDMVLLENSRFSALVTPDHRWPVRRTPNSPEGAAMLKENARSYAKRGELNPMWGRRKHPDWQVFETHELPTDEGWGLPRSAPYVGRTEPVYPDAFVRLVAWYITEGSLRGDEKGISISQSETANAPFVEAIREDLIEVGARYITEKGAYRAKVPGRKGNVRREGLLYRERRANQFDKIWSWSISGTGADLIIQCAPGKKKVPTMSFLASLTQRQARLFVETCLAGDGSKSDRIFAQYESGRMDAYMIAAVLAGLAPSLGKSSTGCALNEVNPLAWLGLIRRKTVFYQGPIWCPSLPSGHWVARRRGRTFITGNTWATAIHQDKGDLDAGFSTLAVFREGDFTGGCLVFPQYRVAVDMQDGDVLLMDAHDWHGNTPFDPEPVRRGKGALDGDPGFERISVVSYFRTDLVRCGSAKDEYERGVMLTEQRYKTLVGE